MNLSALNAAGPAVARANELTPMARARATQLKGPALHTAAPAEQRAAVAGQFEAILVRQLLGKTMTKMLGSGEGAAASVYGDLLTETIATQLTAGPGLGLGRIIEQQLTPRGSDPGLPTREAASTTDQATRAPATQPQALP
ncbi:MAG: hypothetical protein HZA93_04055 [Verrucomicrobia bacterium]|nr:hypothetical protein [Verrucomicrobiota bacterium]